MDKSYIDSTKQQPLTSDSTLPNFHVDLSDPKGVLHTGLVGRLIDSLPIPDGLKAVIPATKDPHERDE
jgi:hypothetical protein